MNIYEYIDKHYDGNPYWFVEEVNLQYHINRIDKFINIKEYLSGKHAILNRSVEKWNGKDFYPRTIVLQYVKPIINFQTSYLLKNPVTLTSNNEEMVNRFKTIYKKGKYDKLDFDILDKMVKYGEVYEVVYLDDAKNIKSKLINPEDSYPVYNDYGDMIAFIEHWQTIDGGMHYNVFYPERVDRFQQVEKDINHLGSYRNLSGLPIVYKTQNEMDNTQGRSDLEDWINIIDNLEDLISKYTDSIYKFINPIPVISGQPLFTEQAINPNVVGQGVQLDDNGKLEFVSGHLDVHSFESVYKTLKQALLDISMTPSVSMNNQDVSNLSEVSIKLLFSLADIKSGLNAKYLKDGFEQRFDKIKKLLGVMGEKYEDEINVVFVLNRPANNKEIIDNLKTLHEINAISLQTILEHSPYTFDVGMEIERIGKKRTTKKKTNNDSDQIN